MHHSRIIHSVRVGRTIGNLLVLLYEIALTAKAAHEVVVAAIAREVVFPPNCGALLAL
jgi:hypothetical protein